MSRSWRTWLLLASLPPALACALAPFSDLCWPAELASHWARHLALLLLPALWAWRKRPSAGAPLLACLLAGLAPWACTALADRTGVPDGPGLVAATGNLLYRNPRRAEAIGALLAEWPDLACVCEAREEDLALCANLGYGSQVSARWPVVHLDGRSHTELLILASRHPLTPHPLPAGLPAAAAELDLPGGRVLAIGMHTLAPISPERRLRRDQALAGIAAVAKASPIPVLLLGDANCSPVGSGWACLEAAGLRRPRGATPATWHAWLGPLGIPIDHILGRDLTLGHQQAFALPGSDHRGLRAQVSWPGR